jgi:catechol 2,3-dioxygenase-like lactoylglutathione lyase family enzyme
VRHLDRSVAFYTEVLGMRLTERFEYPPEEVGHGVTVAAGAFVRCDATHHRISIFQLKDGVLSGWRPGPHRADARLAPHRLRDRDAG